MKPANPRLLTINGGSSSIRFALFEADDSLRRILWRAGSSGLDYRKRP
jgi:acetate kinase